MFASRLAAITITLLSVPSPVATQTVPVAQVQEQTITLFSYGYEPGVIRLDAGVPVTLHFVNRAGKGHDFTAREFFRSSRILSGHVTNGEIDLAARQSKSVTLVPAAGTYEVHCGRPFHKVLGMHGDIVVN